MDGLTISSKEFKALSSKNRVKMLKLLTERNHTLTEISKKIEISSPSAKQHLEVLSKSGLVELLDEGRKWKYYSLTRKGKTILQSKENQIPVFILLSFASIGFIVVVAMIVLPILSQNMTLTGIEQSTLPNTIEEERDKTAQLPQSAIGAPTTKGFQEINITGTVIEHRSICDITCSISIQTEENQEYIIDYFTTETDLFSEPPQTIVTGNKVALNCNIELSKRISAVDSKNCTIEKIK